MIPASKPALARLHREALSLCKHTGARPTLLGQVSDLRDVFTETSRELYALRTTQTIALRMGAYSVADIVEPAIAALEDLWRELMAEIEGEREVRVAHG